MFGAPIVRQAIGRYALQFWSAVGPPYISASCRINPLGGLATGTLSMMWLSGLQGLAGRLRAIDFQAKLEAGEHVGAPYVTQHEVRRRASHIHAGGAAGLASLGWPGDRP